VLITGTDTGVGKTVVGYGLARRLAEGGSRVLAVKPVESGCAGPPADTEDGVLLARASGQEEPRAALVRLSRPVAPPVAADAEGVSLDHEDWCREIRRREAGHDVVIVEGAGGLLSPLTWRATALDLARRLEAAALVVAPDRLGTLNHTLLTVSALEREGVPLLGVVLVAPAAADESTGTNADALRRCGGVDRIAELPRLGRIEESSEHLEAVARWLEAP
jgi:dethiobiotin synthetase